MNNFELIDDYLTNRLEGNDKEGFEKQLESDPALKSDVDLQRQILEGIKSARAVELKSMLNNVPISNGFTFDFSVARLAAGLIGAGVVGAAIYFYLRPEGVPDLKNASADMGKKTEQVQASPNEVILPSEQKNKQEEELTTAKPEEKALVKPVVKEPKKTVAKGSAQPKIEVIDPSAELVANENTPAVSETHNGVISTSHVDVETDTANKKYNFHYQFANGKLFLYGPFDKSLYEILEINSDTHTVFLFYKESYFMLDEKQLKITPLEPIKDEALIKKLKEYRGK